MNGDIRKRVEISIETILGKQANLKALTEKLNDVGSYYERNAKKLGISTEEFEKNFKAQGLILDKVSESLVNKGLKEELLMNKQEFYGKQMQNLGVTGRQVDNILSHYGFTFDKNGQLIDKAGNSVQNINELMKKGKIATNGFNMSLLSTMFFGMALQRTFNGLIKTSMEWVGIQELLNTTLGVVFLPIAEDLLNFLLPVMTWFMDLPEEVQETIGAIALFGAALGTFLLTLGTVGLGLEGIGKLWGGSLVSGLKSNLTSFFASSAFKQIFTIAAIAIPIGFMVKDLSEGDYVAAIGDLTAGLGVAAIAAGLTWGAGVLGVGLLIKVIGEPELLASLTVTFLKIIDMAAWTVESVINLFSFKEVDTSGLKTYQDAIGGTIAKWYEAGTASETMDFAMKDIAYSYYITEQQKLNDAFGEMPEKERIKKQEELADTFKKTKAEVDGLILSIANYNSAISSVESYKNKYGEKSVLDFDFLNSKNLPKIDSKKNIYDVNDAIITPKGIVNTHPDDYLIATKNPNTLGGSGGNDVKMNVTYYVTVSDKREFEEMLQKNNRELLNETRRIVKF
jgi:hypothetical protein